MEGNWERYHRCLKPCDFFGDARCPDRQVCYLLFQDWIKLRGYCGDGNCHVGGICTPWVDPFDLVEHWGIDLPDYGETCTLVEGAHASCALRDGRVTGFCVQEGTQRVCRQLCEPGSNTCPSGLSCIPFEVRQDEPGRTMQPAGVGVCR